VSVAIDPVHAVHGITSPTATREATPAGDGGDLATSFAKAFDDARTYQTDATKATERFAAGDPTMGIHEVMIASEKANVSLRYAVTLKNKCIEAYRELMNTQV
jgi:flagellar hook-basal body complex protein FliE